METVITTHIGPWRQAPAFAAGPIFAIGDVHGRDDLLEVLHGEIRKIAAEDRMDLMDNGCLVHLGDYVDRGPNSIKALKRAIDGAGIPGLLDVTLPGNHEQFLLMFLAEEGEAQRDFLSFWLGVGARAIADELGIENPLNDARGFAQKIVDEIGMERLRKFFELPNHYRHGRYLFVHAGIDPVLGLSSLDHSWHEVRDEDLDPLWIRGPFLTYEGEHDDNVVVIHGHTPRVDPDFRENRIGLDTGAYSSGRLTALQIDGSRCRFIQTHEHWKIPFVDGPAS